MYIYREQEYRKTIDLLKKEIDENSHKPFHVYKDTTEDELQLQGLKLSLHEQKKEVIPKKQQGQPERQKEVKIIHSKMDELLGSIKQMQLDAANKLQSNRTKIWIQLDDNLAKYKAELNAENQNKKGDDFDFQEQEKTLKDRLETMSSMAQKIDEDNQNLTKKNQELRIEFLSQENDRELLLKQIIFHKKINQTQKIKHETLKQSVDELLGTEQQNERILKQATKPTGNFSAFSVQSSVPSIMKGATRAARMNGNNDVQADLN